MKTSRQMAGLIAIALISLSTGEVFAQDEDDAKDTLEELIEAFQRCGPPQAYRILSPNLFNIVAMQTNGSGCYPQIMAAGRVTETEVIAQQEFPLGPLYIVRVHHPSTVADWFIGFNEQTGKVEYLTFQAANQNIVPTIAGGPSQASGPSNRQGRSGRRPATAPTGTPGDPAGVALRDACRKYPEMCPTRDAN